MPRRTPLNLLVLATLACGGAKSASTTPDPDRHPLAGIVGQNIVVAPLQGIWVAPEVTTIRVTAWQPLAARLDSVVTDTVRARVMNQEWVFADALVRAAANNPTYATNPRQLAVNPLKGSAYKLGDRLPEPLASQLRTMIALQEARLVLLPIELRLNGAPGNLARPVVRLVLVDPRMSVVRWIGEVQGADVNAFTPQLYASIAAALADLFVPR